MPDFIYKGVRFTDKQMADFAAKNKMSLNDYVKAVGAEYVDPSEPTYLYKNLEFTKNQIQNFAKANNVSFDNYIKQFNITVKQPDPFAYGIKNTPEQEAKIQQQKNKFLKPNTPQYQQALTEDPVKAFLDPYRQKVENAFQYQYRNVGRQVSESTRQIGQFDKTKYTPAPSPQVVVKNAQESLDFAINKVSNNFFKNGLEAKNYLQEQVKKGKTIQQLAQNETANLAAIKSDAFDKKENLLNSGYTIPFIAVEMAKMGDDNLKKRISILEADYLKKHPQDKQGVIKALPQEMVGAMVHQFISDPDIKIIAERNPKIKQEYQKYEGDNIYKEFPEYGIAYIKDVLSKAREYAKGNNFLANPIFNKSNFMDRLADETFKDRPILKDLVDKYFKGKWEGKIQTPGLVEELAGGAKTVFSGMWRSMKDVVGMGDNMKN